MHDIREATKVDTAIKPFVGASSVTGEYFNMKTYAKALFTAQVSLQENGEEAVLDVYEALNAAGGSAQRLGAAITMLQGIKLTMAQIVVTTGSTINDTLIITPYTFVNGVMTAGTALTFTAKAAESLANRQFDQSGATTAEATSIAACINDATYGIPGVLAVVTDSTILLTMDEPGDGTFTITESRTAVLVVTDLIQQADFEVAVQDMDRADGYTHIGARFSAIESDVRVSCQLIRALAGYKPVGQVSAYNDDAS